MVLIFFQSGEFSSRLKKILGFRPGNLKLYEIAFIHRSATFTMPDGKKVNNERLEFLGDAVLDAILSDYLFEKFPDATEGFMTKIRSRIVNRDILNQLAIINGNQQDISSVISVLSSQQKISMAMHWKHLSVQCSLTKDSRKQKNCLSGTS